MKNGGAGPRRSVIVPRPSPIPPPGEVLPRMSEGAGEATAAAAPDLKPFKAWPDLKAPLMVEEAEAFELTVGFATERNPRVMGEAMIIVDAPETFELGVHVNASGFEAPKGWVHSLQVQRDAPAAHTLKIPLVARKPDMDVSPHTLGVVFFYQDRVCGMAQRNILVVKHGHQVAPAELQSPNSFVSQPVRSVPVWTSAEVAVPDLTVTIQRADGNVARGNFVWRFDTPHLSKLPDPVRVDLGDDDAATYTRDITSRIVSMADSGSVLLDEKIRGAGRDISDHVPQELWQVLTDVAKMKAGVPDVFLLTEEGSIPWELAWMDPPLDTSQPNHLGAQVNLGRWVLGQGGRPPLPPVDRMDVKHMAVVFGDYEGESALPEALEERDQLKKTYQANPFQISEKNLNALLEGEMPPGGYQVVHFACHGEGDPTKPGAIQLVLHDGTGFSALTLRGATIGERNQPFMFLNACEVGTAGEQLGELSGFVEAALKSGFRGFVGPLWQVSSATARDIAVEFYERTLGKGERVSEVLRDMRRKFSYDKKSTPDDTYLAYVFYGHPGLRLTRTP